MNQLEQIEQRIEEAERKKDEAGRAATRAENSADEDYSLAVEARFFGEIHAYTQAAALARPLQEGINRIRYDLWDLATNEEGAREDSEYCTRGGSPISAAIFRGRADAFHWAVITLQHSLERAGLS